MVDMHPQSDCKHAPDGKWNNRVKIERCGNQIIEQVEEFIYL